MTPQTKYIYYQNFYKKKKNVDHYSRLISFVDMLYIPI